MSTNFRIGVCLLDHPNHGDGPGVAALNGDVRVVRALSELDKSASIMWLTNIDYETFKNHKLFVNGNVKPDQILRSRVENLVKEFGMGDMARADIALLLSRIAQSTFNYAAVMTGKPIIDITNSSQRLDWILRERARPNARFPTSADAPWISVAMDAHLFNYATYPSRGDFIKRFYTVPRTEMARVLLQGLPYPSLFARWQHIEFPKAVPLSAHEPLPAELAGRAAFVRVTIRNLQPDRDALSPFSKRSEKGAIIPRNWIALPEAISYAADGVVEVHAAFVNEYEKLKLECPLPSPSDEPLIAANLYAESFIYACGGKTGLDQNRRPRATGHCALAAYMWAYERAYMLKLAKIFQQRGVGQITTIGSLQLQIQMLPNMVDMADTLALSLGLEPPMRPFEALESGVPPYVETLHQRKSSGAGVYQMPSFSEVDWILNPESLIRKTAFSYLKAGGTLGEILQLDALGSEVSKSPEGKLLTGRAIEAAKARLPGLREAVR